MAIKRRSPETNPLFSAKLRTTSDELVVFGSDGLVGEEEAFLIGLDGDEEALKRVYLDFPYAPSGPGGSGPMQRIALRDIMSEMEMAEVWTPFQIGDWVASNTQPNIRARVEDVEPVYRQGLPDGQIWWEDKAHNSMPRWSEDWHKVEEPGYVLHSVDKAAGDIRLVMRRDNKSRFAIIIPLNKHYSEDRSPKLTMYIEGEELEPFGTLTVFMANSHLAENEILVKAYGENEQIAIALRNTPYFQDTGRRVSSGYVVGEVWRTNLIR